MDNQTAANLGNELPPAAIERTHGEVTDDITISAAVRSSLMWSQKAHALNAEVETTRGVVVLRGSADSATSKNLAGLLAVNTQGVRAVDNRLEVRRCLRESF